MIEILKKKWQPPICRRPASDSLHRALFSAENRTIDNNLSLIISLINFPSYCVNKWWSAGRTVSSRPIGVIGTSVFDLRAFVCAAKIRMKTYSTY